MDRIKTLCTYSLLCAGIILSAQNASAQLNGSDLPDTPSQSQLERHRDDPGSRREVSWRSLPKNFLQDQKRVWLFPAQLAKGRHWVPTLAISSLTAGLLVADPHAMLYFETH